MLKYCQIINSSTGLVSIGEGTNTDFYESIGMVERDVEQSDVDNQWYLTEKCPHKSEEEKLKEAKQAKIEENDTKRDNALIRGVEYREVLFDSDTDQKVNLLGKISEMGDEDVITWFGMDNVPLECTKQDLACIGGLIIQLHTFCWNHNAEIKNKIAKAKTVKQVEAIEINYEGVN